jgi:phospholipase D-like protein
MFGRLGIPEIGVLLVFTVIIGLWIWMLIEAATKERSDSQDRLIWVLIILLGGPLGALIYLIVRRPKRKAELGA